MSCVSVVAVPCGHKVGKGHGFYRTITTGLCKCIRSINPLMHRMCGQENHFEFANYCGN